MATLITTAARTGRTQRKVPRRAGTITTRMRFRAYPIVADAVERGMLYGIGRVFKHREQPTITEQELRDQADTLTQHVLDQLCEVIDFDPEPEP